MIADCGVRIKDIDVVGVRGSSRTIATDRAVVEEPLEIRLHGRPFAVVMRTATRPADSAGTSR